MAVTIANPKAGGAFGNQAKPVEDVVTSDTGTVAKGFRSASFYNAGATNNATVNGEVLQPGVSKTYPYVGWQYDDEIAFSASTTTLNILVVY